MNTAISKRTEPRFPDPHIRRTAPPSPVVLKPAALPPTAQAWTLVGWDSEGERHTFVITTAPSFVPGELCFAQCLADKWERESGEPVHGIPEVQHFVAVKGNAEVQS
jgi:hypothetical protein